MKSNKTLCHCFTRFSHVMLCLCGYMCEWVYVRGCVWVGVGAHKGAYVFACVCAGARAFVRVSKEDSRDLEL